jgi:hypothetical protein
VEVERWCSKLSRRVDSRKLFWNQLFTRGWDFCGEGCALAGCGQERNISRCKRLSPVCKWMRRVFHVLLAFNFIFLYK